MIGVVIGFILGAGAYGAGGAVGGAMVGALVGGSAHALVWMWAHSGNAPVVERHRVMCTPYGAVADIDFEGDLQRRRWTDVKRCSLLQVATEVSCDKRCLRRINDARVRPGGACDCQAQAG
ncbi:MAG: hypothetical protein IPL61_03540 [Myxococcales bacterium]|nr:hypothetical protein [Myxococcales bacterium]